MMSPNVKQDVNLQENVDPKTRTEAPPYAIDPIDEKRVVRKLDRVILPLMAFVYFFQCYYTHLITSHFG